jgi:hypothetical protein
MNHLANVARLVAFGIAAGPVTAARADDPCAAFSWNVTHERALFATAAQALTAARDAASAPTIDPDRQYELSLAPREQVHLAAAPARKNHGAETGFAGLVRLHISAPGSYRVSIAAQAWIDVVGDNMLIGSSDFAAAHGCDAPHKIVQYDLQPGTFLLQLTGATSQHVRVVLTRPPG